MSKLLTEMKELKRDIGNIKLKTMKVELNANISDINELDVYLPVKTHEEMTTLENMLPEKENELVSVF